MRPFRARSLADVAHCRREAIEAADARHDEDMRPEANCLVLHRLTVTLRSSSRYTQFGGWGLAIP